MSERFAKYYGVEGVTLKGWPEEDLALLRSRIVDSELHCSRTIPTWTRRLVWKRDRWACVWCDERDVQLHIDHIYPWSFGGLNTTDNLQTLCYQCNGSKGDHPPFCITCLEWVFPYGDELRCIRETCGRIWPRLRLSRAIAWTFIGERVSLENRAIYTDLVAA